jgi:hypothetical protein
MFVVKQPEHESPVLNSIAEQIPLGLAELGALFPLTSHRPAEDVMPGARKGLEDNTIQGSERRKRPPMTGDD